MMKENNFTKAVKELLGEKDVTASEERTFEAPPARPAADEEPPFAKTEFKQAEYKAPEVKAEFKPNIPTVAYSETYINAATTINGSITTKTDIVIEGRVTGDIITENNVNISGKIDGNVEGNFVAVNGGYVIGNITAKSKVSTDSAAVVVGDIAAESFTSNGKIKGNLKIGTAVTLNSNAVVFGNVSAKGISIEDGAVLKGNIQIVSPTSDSDDIFDYPKNNMDMKP